MTDKGALRRQIRSIVKSRSSADRAERESRLNAVLQDLFSSDLFVSVETRVRAQRPDWDRKMSESGREYFAAFQPLPEEPDPLPALRAISEKTRTRFAFPVVDGETLRFLSPLAEPWPGDEDWVPGPWGLREPRPDRSREVALEELSGALVPGLAFDREGVRLGRGKGFYDRALERFNGLKIGVAFADQLVDAIPCEAHDVRMDLLVTEDGVLEPRTAAGPTGEAAAPERKTK